MSTSLTVFDGWDLDVAAVEEPRVRDVDVAVRGGMKRPRDVRQLIERNRAELEIYGPLEIRGAAPRNGPGRLAAEYWLTEEQALALVGFMRTVNAQRVRVALVKLFVAYRRGQLVPPTALPLDIAHGPRVGALTTTKSELRDACIVAANASGRSLRAIHGYVRTKFGIPGIYHLSIYALPIAKSILHDVATRRLVLATKARVLRLVAKDPRQVPLPLEPPSS